MASIVVRIEGTSPWEIELDRNEAIIGRSPDCDIHIDAEGVSREHAYIRMSGGKITIEDNESRNGTFVNEERVETRALRPGDRVRLGPAVELELVDRQRRSGSGRAAR